MSFKEKYLKYKNKYLSLKDQIGGAAGGGGGGSSAAAGGGGSSAAAAPVAVVPSKNDFKIPVVDASSTPAQIETAMETLVDEVKCPVCLSNIKSVVFCAQGHCVCNSCIHGIQTCPICRSPKLANPRNIL